MKKVHFFIVSLFSLLLLFSIQSVAYGSGDKRLQDGRSSDREAYFAKRNTFIAAKMGLTAEEVAVFIPLENELFRKKIEIRRDCRKVEFDMRDKKNKTDEDYNKILRSREDEKEKTDKLEKEYHVKFKKYLSSEKMFKYLNADREFFEDYYRDRRR